MLGFFFSFAQKQTNKQANGIYYHPTDDGDNNNNNNHLDCFVSGLQERGLYRDKVNLFRAIRNLRSTENEGGFCPTLHAIRDLIGDDFTGGSIVIIAQSKISDEDFAEVLAESLWARKCQVKK